MTKNESRFDGLFSVAKAKKEEAAPKGDVQTSEHLNVQISKSSSSDYQRTTLYLPKILHRKFKAASAIEGKDMSDIMTELIQEWINSREIS